jgi:acetyl-CoA C-acetyltransferase
MMSGMLGNQSQLGGWPPTTRACAASKRATRAACAAGGVAARIGYLTVAGGVYDIVVVCGLERMTHVDRDTAGPRLATAPIRARGGDGESFLSLNAQLMRIWRRSTGRGRRLRASAVTAPQRRDESERAPTQGDRRRGYLASRVVSDPKMFDARQSATARRSCSLRPAAGARRIGACGSPRLQLRRRRRARRSDPLKLDAVEASRTRSCASAFVAHRLDLFELHDAYTIMSVLTLESADSRNPVRAREPRPTAASHSTATCRSRRSRPQGPRSSGRGHGVLSARRSVPQLMARGRESGARRRVALVEHRGTGATVVSYVLRRVA